MSLFLANFRDCICHGVPFTVSPAEDRRWGLGAKKQKAFWSQDLLSNRKTSLESDCWQRSPSHSKPEGRSQPRAVFVWDKMAQLTEVGTQWQALLSLWILWEKPSGWEVAILANNVSPGSFRMTGVAQSFFPGWSLTGMGESRKRFDERTLKQNHILGTEISNSESKQRILKDLYKTNCLCPSLWGWDSRVFLLLLLAFLNTKAS